MKFRKPARRENVLIFQGALCVSSIPYNTVLVPPRVTHLLVLVVKNLFSLDLSRGAVDGEERFLGHGVGHLTVDATILILSLRVEGAQE